MKLKPDLSNIYNTIRPEPSSQAVMGDSTSHYASVRLLYEDLLMVNRRIPLLGKTDMLCDQTADSRHTVRVRLDGRARKRIMMSRTKNIGQTVLLR